MTEAEWLASEDPNVMHIFLYKRHGVYRRKAGKRKMRLFGCASCRLFGDALCDPRSIAAVEYMERFADGEADPAAMDDIAEQARLALLEAIRRRTPRSASQGRSMDLRVQAAEAAFNVVGRGPGGGSAHAAMRGSVGDADTPARRAWLAQRQSLALLFREVFGNPFRELTFHKKWRTSTVNALARQVHTSRDFSAMPILADALEDAGCDNADILTHCRGPGPHVLGCWALDLVLAKA